MSPMPNKRKLLSILGAAVVAAVAYFLNPYLREQPKGSGDAPARAPAPSGSDGLASRRPPPSSGTTATLAPTRSDDEAVAKAFRDHKSDVIVELQGTVVKKLSDDNEGSRHQKFILRLASGLTLLVAHNIDLAPRVPVGEGDTVHLRGEYEWSDQGGVLHWTHHDPKGRREGGWIEHEGRRYE